MENIPNLESLIKQIRNLDNEFDIPSRINRYLTVLPELIDSAKKLGLDNSEDAARAFFISDYIITSSEVPIGTTDEIRNASVIESFKIGLKRRSPSSDALMRIFYLAYKIAIQIRQNDIMQSDRGINRRTGLLRIKDAFLTPFLILSQDYLGKAPSGWELGVLQAALNKSLPHLEIESLNDIVPQSIETPTLLHFTWKLLEVYALRKNISLNTHETIPNLGTTSSVLIFDTSMPSIVSVWNQQSKMINDKSWTNKLALLANSLNENDQSLIYLRGDLQGTEEQLIMVREPSLKSNPLVIFKTQVNEVNVSLIQSILRIRGLEGRIWTTVEFSNLQNQQQVTESRKLVAVARKRKLIGIARPFHSSNEPRPDLPPVYLPSFICKALTLEAVGDIPLFEVFDTVRESNYTLLGLIEVENNSNNTTHYVQPGFDYSKEINQTIKNLTTFLNEANSYLFGNTTHFQIKEVVFLLKNDNKLLVCIAGDRERSIITVAISHTNDITQLGQKTQNLEFETYKRRMLHMRTGQLVNARRVTILEEAVSRIFGSALSDGRIVTENNI